MTETQTKKQTSLGLSTLILMVMYMAFMIIVAIKSIEVDNKDAIDYRNELQIICKTQGKRGLELLSDKVNIEKTDYINAVGGHFSTSKDKKLQEIKKEIQNCN